MLEWSQLGLEIQGLPPAWSRCPPHRFQSSATHDETWTSPQGKANPIRDHYNAVTVRTSETGARAPAAQGRGPRI